MLDLAYRPDITVTPFRSEYETGGDRFGLADRVYVRGLHRAGDELPVDDVDAVIPQVIQLPDRSKFEQSLTHWFNDIAFDSFPDMMMEHDSFQEIVAMGYGVVPLIASSLRRRPSFLFLALEQILSYDPVPEAAWGDLAATVKSWLEWLER